VLMAYEDLGFKIKDSTEDTRVSLHPIDNPSKAKEILARAKKERPDVRWSIKSLTKRKGPYGVHGIEQ
jgi:hypothetical protein